MGRLEHAITRLQEMQSLRDDAGRTVGPVCGIVVTLCYLVAMLSVPVDRLGMLLWFAVYPIVASPYLGRSFTKVFLRSLYTLPFIIFIGIFNPVFDTVPAMTVGSLTVSRGWITFVSIVFRGLMSVQAIMILVEAVGFEGVCRGLRRIGVPAGLVTQLLMVYRYMTVLLTECLNMRLARMSRCYGRTRMSLSMWGRITGQLFLRTVARSERINRAMLARGFNGAIPLYGGGDTLRPSRSDIVFAAVCCISFLILRFFDISGLLGLDGLI